MNASRGAIFQAALVNSKQASSSTISPTPSPQTRSFWNSEPFLRCDVHDYITVRVVFGRYHHDGRLLPAFGQRRQQPPLPRGMAHTKVLPAPVELVKLQLHQTG
jgi:hypothetical protein